MALDDSPANTSRPSSFKEDGTNKKISGWGFCDIQNSEGWGKPKAAADNPYWDLDYSGYHKTNTLN